MRPQSHAQPRRSTAASNSPCPNLATTSYHATRVHVFVRQMRWHSAEIQPKAFHQSRLGGQHNEAHVERSLMLIMTISCCRLYLRASVPTPPTTSRASILVLTAPVPMGSFRLRASPLCVSIRTPISCKIALQANMKPPIQIFVPAKPSNESLAKTPFTKQLRD